MEALYPYAHIVHLLLAIAFLGYVFSDVVVLSVLKKSLDKESEQKVHKLLSKRSFKIFPLTLLVLVLSGGMMLSRYINSEVGAFNTPLQQLLMVKLALVSIIVLGVAYNLYSKFTNRPKIGFMANHFHKLVLVLGIGIVIAAKMMFVV